MQKTISNSEIEAKYRNSLIKSSYVSRLYGYLTNCKEVIKSASVSGYIPKDRDKWK
jgi:hypothetical protein